MDTSVTDPLVFLHLLADRQGTFSALRLAVAGGAADSLTSFVEHPDFLGLASQFPCLFYLVDAGKFSEECANALVLAGCRPVTQDRIGRADQQLGNAYPTEVEWLDGNWYLSPPIKPIGNQAASRALALQLVQLVSADAENREIEAIFRRDPALSYQLLRLVNSLAIGAGRRITSFSQAIVMLGRKQLRRWLNLMVFASREGDKRSTMLLANVAIRARMMELLARASGLDFSLQDQAFMVGMFSQLGTLFGMPIEEILRPLTISDAMRAAVLARDGELGNLLNLLEIVEHGDFPSLRKQLEAIQVASADFNLFVVQACNWMLGVVRDSHGDGHA
jgi:c-di-GMP-related signal transduction protein